jgi:hypothetical protein
MFGKKQECPRCASKMNVDFDFCPHCGCDVRSPEKDMKDYGLLGKDEFSNAPVVGGGAMGFSDKLIGSIFNSLMKSLESQMKSMPMEQMPGNIQIKVGVPQQKPRAVKKRVVSDDQVKRMAGVPRVEAKTEVRRLSDKVLYELKAPGIGSVEDVFVSKVESGYEVKAIGKNKVYINSLQVDLPLKSYTVHDKGLTVEFGLQ